MLVILFDAFSAHHLSLYGYGRKTTPNLDRLARRAIVYHDHYATSGFTTPGTASLLTGTYPWKHRANHLKHTIDDQFLTRNLFSAFPDYHRIAYTHNPWVEIFLEQLSASIDEWKPMLSLFLRSSQNLIQSTFRRDRDISAVSLTQDLDIASDGYSYSLFLSRILDPIRRSRYKAYEKDFPRGVPRHDTMFNEFLLETAIEWTGSRLPQLRQPFLGYFHFLPPHDPYRTPARFNDFFTDDGFRVPEKPEDVFTRHINEHTMQIDRRQYDEYILYVDEQFGRLFEDLESSGLLENTWIVFTSDHGELHERGITGHIYGALYEPVIRVPLVIFEPGRTSRQDVFSPTSAVDILPTLLYLTGHPMPDWSEGILLPNFASHEEDQSRTLYAIRDTTDKKYGLLLNATTALIKGRQKLMCGFGREGEASGEFIRLYDLENDPDELNDLAATKPALASELLHELKQKLDEVNAPYMQTS